MFEAFLEDDDHEADAWTGRTGTVLFYFGLVFGKDRE